MMKKGFTLIETIIYIALLSFLLGGILQSAFWLIQSAENESATVQTAEEIDFVEHKLDFLLSGISDIQSPTGAQISQTLQVTKYDFAGNPIVITSKNGVLTLSRSGTSAVALTSSNIHIDAANFSYLPANIAAGTSAGIQSVISIDGTVSTSTYYEQ